MPDKSFKITKFDDLYDFWLGVPMIEEVSEYIYTDIASQPFRDAILWILRTGIEDENRKKRYALSAPEMLPLIRKKLKSKISLTNVYFHIEKLEKYDLIKKIFTQKEGKTFVSFYGRTSKLIIFSQSKILSQEDRESIYSFTDLLKLANNLNYTVNIERISEIIDAITNRNLELYDLEKKWMIDNQEILLNNDIDIYKLYGQFQNRLRLADPTLKSLHEVLYKEIGLDIYSLK